MHDTREVMNKVYEKNKKIIDKIKKELDITFLKLYYQNNKTGENNLILENEFNGKFRPLD